MKDFPMKQFSVMQGVRYMENKSYQLRYLPLFEQDLISTANYITNVLKNEDAALRLIDDVETAILERLNNPVAFEPYRSAKKRDYPYYRIYVRNYVIYYVVIGDVMEVRRLMYGARDTDRLNRTIKSSKSSRFAAFFVERRFFICHIFKSVETVSEPAINRWSFVSRLVRCSCCSLRWSYC